VASRAERFGPNTLAAAKVEPRWRAFLRQHADPMQMVLVVAGAASIHPLQQWGTASC
jgi:Ca2+-transporting ATPase